MDLVATLEECYPASPKAILEDHGIPYETNGHKIFAIDTYYDREADQLCSSRLDVTDWNIREFRDWLGY